MTADHPSEAILTETEEAEPVLPHIEYDYRRGGSPTAIYVHGFGEGRYVWNPVIEHVNTDFGAITLDLRGHGDSAWDDLRRYSVESYADDIETVIKAAGVRQYILVGHSLGAAASLALALRRPAGLMGLVLIDYGSRNDRSGHSEIAQRALEQRRTYDSVDEYLKELANNRPLGRKEILGAYANEALRRTGPARMTLKYDPAIFGRRPAVDLLSKLTMVACSTMIVRGAYSSVLSKAEALRLAQTSCVTDFCEIAMAGHAIMSENPEDLVKRLNHFFEQLSYGLLRAWSLAPGSTR